VAPVVLLKTHRGDRLQAKPKPLALLRVSLRARTALYQPEPLCRVPLCECTDHRASSSAVRCPASLPPISRALLSACFAETGMVVQPPHTSAFVPRHRWVPPNASPPTFEPITQGGGLLYEGSDAKFQVQVHGNPAPEVVFTRRGMPLRNDPRRQVTYDPATGICCLIIRNLTAEDDGDYNCSAVNCVGEASLTLTIRAAAAAVMRGQMQQMTTVQRTQVVDSRMHLQDGTSPIQYFAGHDQSFRVDTFEYRLLREVEFRDSLLGPEQPEPAVPGVPISAPQIQQRPRNSKLLEGSDATFTVRIAGNPPAKVHWFRNGERLQASQRVTMEQQGSTYILRVHMALPEDAGYYTALAENSQGRVACSAHLVIEAMPKAEEPRQPDPASCVTTETSRTLKPNFVKIPQDQEVTEGKMVRFDVRVTGRPFPDVTWLRNGQPVNDDATHKLLVNEGGLHALMITSASREDAGTWTCVANNKSGECRFEVHLVVIEKEQVVAPKFVERFQSLSVHEGESVTMHCRAVGTPTPRITWQKDGRQIHSQPPDLIIETQDGSSALYLNRARADDSAWYQCTAQNQAGSTATRARLHVKSEPKTHSEPWKLHLPKPSKVIQPERSPPRETIWLRHVERAYQPIRSQDDERAPQKPAFTTHLQNLMLHEGERGHLDARLIPIGDETMVIEWFCNGRAIEASSRVMTTYRFGYVALTLLHVYPEDSGVYVCRATNEAGEATTTATLRCTAQPAIERRPIQEDSVKAIQELEDMEKYSRHLSIDETASLTKPCFIRPLSNKDNLLEGKASLVKFICGNCHFEAQLTPVNDPTMKVEWFLNGQPLTTGKPYVFLVLRWTCSRINCTFSFGYVALNIMSLRCEDSGVYMCRATNAKGDAVSTATLRVKGLVTGDLGIPEQEAYIRRTQELEAYQQSLHAQKEIFFEPVSTEKPNFKTGLRDQLNVKENSTVHFEARLEPTGDSSMRVEWFKDGRALEASSRTTTFFNFGYVSLTIRGVDSRDSGVYTCKATNAVGTASTEARLVCLSQATVVRETQHPDGLQKIQHLEDSSHYQRSQMEEVSITQAPKFTQPLQGPTTMSENQSCHFETRLEPMGDADMKVEWFHNGRPLATGHRFKTYFDFGYVALDILYTFPEDTGVFEVRATNRLGADVLRKEVTVQSKAAVDTSTIHEMGMDKIEYLERSGVDHSGYHIEEVSRTKPYFKVPLKDPKGPLREGESVIMECAIEPVQDPTMKVEWFFNGRPLPTGHRFITRYDFGRAYLQILNLVAEDTGQYTLRATNHLGSAHSTSCIKVIGRSGVITESQYPEGWEKIQHLEDHSRYSRQEHEESVITQKPTFSRPLHNVETVEGANVHLECRLQPVGDPTMRVEWYRNSVPIKVGHRFRPAHDFDYVALDILSFYPEDSGIYTCKATSSLGENVTSCSVNCFAKSQLILESQHPEGLQKIQQLEDQSRYRRDTFEETTVKTKPSFTSNMTALSLREGQNAHLECRLEPVNDADLRVEWYRNGVSLPIGHRYRPFHDFGYVALNILSLVPEDSGTYTVRATNSLGKAELSTTVLVEGKSSIDTDTQHPEGLQKIQALEGHRYRDTGDLDQSVTTAPVFTSAPKSIVVEEGQKAHLECRLIPVGDPKLKVEWFRNGQPVPAGSRFVEMCNFGFVSLDILATYAEDSGTYTCKATNQLGEAVVSAQLKCAAQKSLILETQNQEAYDKIQQLEAYGQQPKPAFVEELTTQAPVFTQPMNNLNLKENQSAHFECKLIPVGDPNLRVEWFHNGLPLQKASRVNTIHDFGFVALDLSYVKPEDSGTYTCKATNSLGQAVCTATLNVQGSKSLVLDTQHPEGLQKIQQLEELGRYKEEVTHEAPCTSAPMFLTPLQGPNRLSEGQSAHLECRIAPYPDATMKVQWFHNGVELQTGHRFRTIYDFGFCALDILTANAEHSGEYVVQATNALGTARSTAHIHVDAKGGVIIESQQPDALPKIRELEESCGYIRPVQEETIIKDKPNFVRGLYNLDAIQEGQSAHLEATVTPTNDANMKIQWFHNGVEIPLGHRFKTVSDFGFVALDILYAYPEDSGTYMCKATNKLGEAVTTCSIQVLGKSAIVTDTLHEKGLEKIRQLEEYRAPEKAEQVIQLQRPVFTVPLNSVDGLVEGQSAHLECRLEPINDPDLKVQWFFNGVEIRPGHRFRTTHDFGYVALDALYVYAEDSGTYMCKATNKLGEAVTTCNVRAQAKQKIYYDTHHPEGLEKIRELENQVKYQAVEIQEKPISKPVFITELRGSQELSEGDNGHLECRVEPAHDPKLKIEILHNGRPLTAATRVHITSDFGYVAIDLSHAIPEDSGTYTVRATNDLGTAETTATLRVLPKSGIISDTQHPEGELNNIRQMEDEARFKPEVIQEPVTFQRPVFTVPLNNLDNLVEDQRNVHLECRLIPVGDPTLKVEWFFNDTPLMEGTRFHPVHDFGYVALDMDYVRPEDTGVYTCRATNSLGQAVTTCMLKIRPKASILRDSLQPQGYEKIRQMEDLKGQKAPEKPDTVYEKPVFTSHLVGPGEINEGQPARLECRCVPVGDPDLRFHWYVNGVELPKGSRLLANQDFGFVTLDIVSGIAEDSGVYMCKAVNKAGEAVTSTSLRVKGRSGVLLDSHHPEAYKQTQKFEYDSSRIPETWSQEKPKVHPVFVQHLNNIEGAVEGHYIRIEGRIEPTNDEKLKVTWFKNGKTLVMGTRIKPTYDFGLVSLDISSARPDDSGIYTCKATNEVGEAISTCTIKVEGRENIILTSQHPDALPKLRQLEEYVRPDTSVPEPDYEGPVFVTHLNNLEIREGAPAHLECRVEPSKDPTLKIEFLKNNKPLPAGTKYNVNNDFGFVTLDIGHTFPDDSGIYTCRARNAKGEAVTTGSVKVQGKSGVLLDTLHPMGQQGLSKVQELETAYMSRYEPPSEEAEKVFPRPVFVVPLEPNFSVQEGSPVALECKVEPAADPKLKVEWFLNGKPLAPGSRYTVSHDFGFVVLALTDFWGRDAGVYTCRASNDAGEAFTTTTITCLSKRGVQEDTLHPEGRKGLESIQNLEDSLTRAPEVPQEDITGQPPVFTSQFVNLKDLNEGDIAHFEATLTPVGDQTMQVEWFFRGKPLKAGHRIRTVHAFGMVVLEILGAVVEDSGRYTCRAANKWGKAEVTVDLECTDKSKGQRPQFTTQLQNLVGLKEGNSAHMECHLIPVGDPDMKVEWYRNSQPLRDSSRIKTLSDFGYVVMDISFVHAEDSGDYVCVATNKYGSDATKCTIQCEGSGKIFRESLQPQSLDKIAELEGHAAQTRTHAVMEATRLQPPKFVTQLNSITNLSEGQSAHFECQLVPVNDPDLTVEWYFNGQLLRSGHRFRTFHDFGIVILDILYCYGEDSGEWVCKATNKLGSDVTRATIACKSKSSLILTPQLPPEMASGTQSIIALEESLYRTSAAMEPEVHAEAPRFTVPLSNVDDLREGDNAHLEARLTPTDDPDLTVEWFKNNMPLMSGTRIRTINDFGFVVLEMSPVYPEDSGVYSCRARNRFGEAVTTCTLKCQGKRSIILETQLPESMTTGIEKLAKFEEISSARIGETWSDKEISQPPKFVTTPTDLTLGENSLAHFECRLTPIGDPTLRVDWYHNGRPLVTGSRVKTISDFGYVILEVAGVYPRDSGVYTCRAVNKAGEASVSCKLDVKGKHSIVMEPQLPHEFRSGYESIQKLEESMYRTEDKIFDDDKKEPPKFLTQIQSLLDKVEGDSAHFECKLVPVGDPNMKVEWFLNGRPLVTGTRVHTIDDFGFVVLDIDWLFPRDSGEFMCRATNRWGSDTTKATLKIKAKKDIIMDSQLPEGMSMDKLRDLEYPVVHEQPQKDEEVVMPRFITQIQPQENLNEGDSAHFECRLEPLNDPKLRVEWYHNGQPLRSGHRFKTTHDFGFVALDVLYVYPEDSGTYVARAVNDVGEDKTQATLKCIGKPRLDYRTQLPKDMKDGVRKIAEMEASWQRTESQEEVPEEQCAPQFIMKPEPQTVVEGEWAKFQCRVMGHPKPRLIWVLNGHTVISGSRYKLTYDGIYHLDIPKSRQYDQGKVEVFARNFCGEAYCFTTLEVRPKHDDYRAVLKHSPRPWYDQDVKSYQKYRHETELQRVFEEKLTPGGTKIDVWKTEASTEGDHQKIKQRLEEEDLEKLKPKVERFKTDSIYLVLVTSSIYRLEITGAVKFEQHSSNTITVRFKTPVPQPSLEKQQRIGTAPESMVQGREVHVTTQKQTQKEQQGDLEITRKKTLTETLEQEHKGVTKEKRVQGPVQESKAPVFTKKIQPCRVDEGQGAKFQCTFTGQPSPKITWFRENFPIQPSQDFQIVTTDTTSTLIIREVYLEDSGVFSVKAENRGGSAKSSANLVVEERREQRSGVAPPNFTKTIQDVSVKAGKLVRLDAKVSGSKPFDVYWLKNGKKVTPDVSHKIIEEENQYTLLILEAQVESDSGSYECVAINSAGEARCQAHVLVEGAKPKTPPTSPKDAPGGDAKPPTVTEPLKPLAVKEGQSAVFRCKIPAVPGAQVKWYRGDQLVKQSRYFRMSQENNLFTLKISEAFPEDEGEYKCVATNPAGTVSTSANLKVIVPELNEVPPSVTPLADLTVPEGSPARFVTSLGGVPPPKVIWVREGHVIKQSRDFQTLSRLII
ncbi:unnamed protein product, partial [Ixodes persulcatus]